MYLLLCLSQCLYQGNTVPIVVNILFKKLNYAQEIVYYTVLSFQLIIFCSLFSNENQHSKQKNRGLGYSSSRIHSLVGINK